MWIHFTASKTGAFYEEVVHDSIPLDAHVDWLEKAQYRYQKSRIHGIGTYADPAKFRKQYRLIRPHCMFCCVSLQKGSVCKTCREYIENHDV